MPSSLIAFLLVFAVVGATELIDRTSLTLIGLAARQPPLRTWAGAALAFGLTSAIAVLLGSALLDLLHGRVTYLRLGGGLFLLGYAAYLAGVSEEERRPRGGRSAFGTAFLLTFLLELGDTTMILMVVFVSAANSPLLVFGAGALALILVAGWACFLGSRLGTRLEPARLNRVIIALLVLVGVVTILYALVPGWFPSFG